MYSDQYALTLSPSCFSSMQVEHGRVHRHYNIQSPYPEGYVGDMEGDEGPNAEQYRFYKWVKRINTEYRAYGECI